MYANAQAGYLKYQQNDILNLTQAEIVDRLFKALYSHINDAMNGMQNGSTSRKGEKISRAIAIAGELQASLNMEEGGELSERLNALYDFVIRELLFANMENDVERLGKVKEVIRPLMEGWSAITEKNHPSKVQVTPGMRTAPSGAIKQVQIAG